MDELEAKTIEVKIKKALKNLKEEARKLGIKGVLEIIFLGGTILAFIITAFQGEAFQQYYNIPEEYKDINLYRIFRKLILVCAFFLVYYYRFNIERIETKTEKEKKLLSLLSFMVGAMTILFIGIILYIMFADILTFYITKDIQNKMLNYSKFFYWVILIGFIVVSMLQFYLLKSSKKMIRKIGEIIVFLIILIFSIYFLKEVADDSYWKRKYEVIIKNNNKVEVVLAKKGDRLIVASGQIEERDLLKTLIIDTRMYKSIDSKDVLLQYQTFNDIIINKEKDSQQLDKEIKVKIAEEIVSFKLDRTYLKEVQLNFTTSKFYIGEFKSEKVYGDFKEYLIDEQIFQMIREDYPNIKIYIIENF